MDMEKPKRPKYGGRRKQFSERIQLPLRDGTLERIDAALMTGEIRLDFIRLAIEFEMVRRGHRGVFPTWALSDEDIKEIMNAKWGGATSHDLEDIPEIDDKP